MDTIQAIWVTLSDKNKKEFLNFIKSRNRRGDAKNIDLIKLITSEKTKNLDVVLYGKPNHGAFNALCKRVQDALIEFVASKSFAEESSEDLEVLKLLLASRIFFEQKLSKVAFKTLEKAETQAKKIDNYALLDEIYHTKIQYCYLNPKWGLSLIIADYQANKTLSQQDFLLTMAYARIKLELRKNPKQSINELVVKTFLEFDLKVNEDLTYKSLYQLMEITATTAKLQSDFYTVSPFMMELYEVLETKGKVPEKHKYYYLNMLYLMAVAHFRNKNFTSSENFISQIDIILANSPKTYVKGFDDKVTILKALNKIYTGHISEGNNLLSDSKNASLNKKLLLLMCLIQQGEFSNAYNLFKELNRTDNWYDKKMGWLWVLKKNIIEILLLIELDKLDMVLIRLQRFSRNFTKRLNDIGEKRVLVFMNLIKAYYENSDIVTSEDFKNRVENSFDWIGREQEDIFVMSFYAWLKSKMEEKNLYEVTLELVT